MDGITKAKDRGVKFGRKRELAEDRVEEIRSLRELGETVPAIIKRDLAKLVSIERWGTVGNKSALDR
jgi:DNA invertase Pin-like site-specific DNA recombinase